MSKVDDFAALFQMAGQTPDDEQIAAEEIMKASDGLAKYIINPARSVDEVMSVTDGADHALRPKTLEEIIGQDHIREPLRIAMRAAQRRKEPLGHIILFGPSGLGKTTLASIVAREMDTLLILDTGPQLSAQKLTYYASEIIKAWGDGGDEAMRVTFFVDEAHKIPLDAITVLLPLLEDFRFLSALHTPAFTFVAATTDPGLLPDPFVQRFHYQYHVDYYSTEQIITIVRRNVCKVWGISKEGDIDEEKEKKYADWLAEPKVVEAIDSIAARSRGVPRIANRLIKHVHDYALGFAEEEPEEGSIPELNIDIVSMSMKANGIDKNGLTKVDRSVLVAMATRFRNRAVGIDAIASSVGEYSNTIKQVVEPYLVRSELINRTLRGRELTDKGKQVAVMAAANLIEY